MRTSRLTRLFLFAGLLTFAVVLVFVALFNFGRYKLVKAQEEEPEFVPDEVIVKFLDGTSLSEIDAILSSLDLEVIQELTLVGALHVRILSGESVSSVLAQLSENPNVEYAHPNFIDTLDNHLTEPNDPSYPSQWGLNNRGRNPGIGLGRIDADIDAPQAWEHKTDCRSRIVAILDTGADLTHPDLMANLWTNPNEIAGNGMDDDMNGFIDDVHGADFVNMDGDPTDDFGHGTRVTGVIGAVGNNGVNISGVCWQAQLMIVKTCNAAGCTVANRINGINYAIANGAQIINNSSGQFRAIAAAEAAAIGAANTAGVLFVAAAGNNGLNVDIQPNPFLPCGYVNPNIICVAASNNRELPWGFTNWGPVSVDLFAPGEGIITLRRAADGGGITPAPGVNGTSLAAPYVAGAAAHCWSLFSTETHLQIKARLLNGVDSRPSLREARLAGGPTRVLSGITNDGRLRMCMGDDFGDAPDPFTGPGKYPTLKRNPGLGAGAQIGASHEDIGEEWLGNGPMFRDVQNNGDAPARLHTLEVSPEFDANVTVPLDADGPMNLVNNDSHDDGIIILGPVFGFGIVFFQVCTENHQVFDVEGGRYTGEASPALGDPPRRLVNDKAIYVNGFFDWNQDGDFDDALEYAFSRRFVPPAPGGAAGATTCHGFIPQVFRAPRVLPPGEIWARFRLDYGEDVQHGGAGNAPVFHVGHAAPPVARYDTSPTLNRTRGQAQFGEVEDYLVCDLDEDGDVDSNDIDVIFTARGTEVTDIDPRDIDNDGVITVNDARICTLRCTNPKCAP